MKSEILKKTIIYRCMAIFFGISISVLSIYFPRTIQIGILFGGISETISLFTYYIFEYFWRRNVERRRLRKGTSVLSITGDSKVRIAYEVIEDLGEGKLIIKVV